MSSNGLDADVEVDAQRVLAIIGEEAPHVLELAVRRAIIEQQREVIAKLHAATTHDRTFSSGPK